MGRSVSGLGTRQLTAALLAASLILGCSPTAEDSGASSSADTNPGVEAPSERGAEPAAAPAVTGAPSPPPNPLRHGIDLSVHSGTIDWAALAAQDFDFVYLKATEGVDLADPAFAEHWSAAAEAGLARGAYHFFVTEDDPIAQAEFFISTVPMVAGDLIPVVDIEVIGHDTPTRLVERLRQFLKRLEGHYGVRPMIYTSPNFWSRHLDASFGDHPLWIAEYGVDEPRIPSGWSAWTLWQYADDSDVRGVEKDADLNRRHGDVDPAALRLAATAPGRPQP